MLTRFDGGSAGFSTKAVTRPSGSVARMPNRCASSIGTVRTAHVTSASRSRCMLDEGPVVHLVDVVAGKDEDELRVAVVDEVEVLEHGVSGPAIPLARSTALDERLEQRHSAAAAVEVPGPSDADVVDQGARRVLRQDADVGQAGVHRVAEGEVDDPVLATERDSRLRAHLRQDAEPLALAAREDERQDRGGHGPILAARHGSPAAAAASTAAAAPAAAALRHRCRRRRRRHPVTRSAPASGLGLATRSPQTDGKPDSP